MTSTPDRDQKLEWAHAHEKRLASDVEIVEISMAKTKLDPVHPGEILMEEFMKPLEISINGLARDLHVPPNRIHSILHGLRAITADTALRLEPTSG